MSNNLKIVKNASFMALAAAVGGLLASFFPTLPGMNDSLVLIGAMAALVGAAIGALLRDLKTSRLILFLLIALGVGVFAYTQFLRVADGEPGQVAANWLYFWTTLVFLSLGFIIQLSGLRLTSD